MCYFESFLFGGVQGSKDFLLAGTPLRVAFRSGHADIKSAAVGACRFAIAQLCGERVGVGEIFSRGGKLVGSAIVGWRGLPSSQCAASGFKGGSRRRVSFARGLCRVTDRAGRGAGWLWW